MIISKTPLRVSFFGGGSDIPAFYEKNEGICVSTTINSYIYIALNRCVANHIKLMYSKLELAGSLDAVSHDRVRETLRHFEIESNIEVASFSDVTVHGTGLGSSSTFTVGLINALYKALNHKTIDKHELAELASYIEINKCGELIGKQDQYAAAYGGLNAFYFTNTGVRVKPLKINPTVLYELQHNLYMFNTKITRRTSDVLGEQVRKLATDDNMVAMTKSMVELAKQALKFLEYKKLDDFGDLLDTAWMIKKGLGAHVSNETIDEMYELALSGGALGGKILGAGGGGYLLVYCPEKCRNRLLETMRDYDRLPFKFSSEGSSIEMVS